MSLVVKMRFGDDVRRKRFSNIEEVTLETIKALVNENYGFDCFVAKYLDADGDSCSLTAWTLPNALALPSGGMLKLEITPVPEQWQGSSATPSFGGVSAQQEADAAKAGAGGSLQAALLEASTDFSYEMVDGIAARSGGCGGGESRGGSEGGDRSDQDGHQPGLLLPPNVLSFSIATPALRGSPCNQKACGEAATPEAPDTEPSEQHAAAAPQEAPEPPQDTEAPADAATEPTLSVQDATEPAPTVHEDGTDARGGEQPPATDGINDWDKVCIVLAAFDINGDGHLNLEECNDLQQASWGGRIDADAYAAICTELGADPACGLGEQDLAAMYARYGTLDRDFAAASARLQDEAPTAGQGAPLAAPQAAAAGQATATSACSPCRFALAGLALPLVPLALTCPLVSVPLAVYAAKRMRQA